MQPSSLKRSLFSLLPTSIRIQGRSYIPNLALDLRDQVTGRTDHELPPRHLNISGGGPFREYGQNTVDLCRQYGALLPDDKVLDIGCGIGRTALALTRYLTSGSYTGFDIIRFAVKWCRRNIAGKHQKFHFLHADIYNLTYNPRGKQLAEAFRFPFDSDAFTFAIATSLFTHVLPEAAANYIAEAGRTLSPGGRFLSTWFLLDAVSQAAIESQLARVPFPHRFTTHAQTSLHAPEQAVAYERARIEALYRQHGFEVMGTYRGEWSGCRVPEDTLPAIASMQDVIVARRLPR